MRSGSLTRARPHTGTCRTTRGRSGEPDSDGYVRERIQTNGRCESANGRGDTYGPVSYEAYIPGYLAWLDKWDDLPAAHFTSILFDMLALIGLGLVGRRSGRPPRRHAGLRLGRLSLHPVRVELSNDANDAIIGAFGSTAAPARAPS